MKIRLPIVSTIECTFRGRRRSDRLLAIHEIEIDVADDPASTNDRVAHGGWLPVEIPSLDELTAQLRREWSSSAPVVLSRDVAYLTGAASVDLVSGGTTIPASIRLNEFSRLAVISSDGIEEATERANAIAEHLAVVDGRLYSTFSPIVLSRDLAAATKSVVTPGPRPGRAGVRTPSPRGIAPSVAHRVETRVDIPESVEAFPTPMAAIVAIEAFVGPDRHAPSSSDDSWTSDPSPSF